MRIVICSAFAGLLLLLFNVSGFAQNEPTKGQVSFDYSLVTFLPSANYTSNHNLNGGGASAGFFLNKYIGFKGDFQGYGSTTFPFSIPAPTPLIVNPGVYVAQGNLFTYLFGPAVRRPGKVEPFGEILFGGAHTNVYTNFFKAAGVSTSTHTDAFAMTVGGGLDIRINRIFSVRPVELGYLLTRFSNAATGAHNQDNFRYVAGVALNF